jgi:la-related protein 4
METNTQGTPLEGDQLDDALVKQVDYYFSRQNLANDAYLVSQMDADMWVPINVIAGFKKVGMLTKDADHIARVMSKSPNVVVDLQKNLIKPSWKLQRNTIILREMPADTTAEEIRALFGEKFAIVDVHSDVGNSWFVSFDTEDTALDAMVWVRNQQFRGNEIKARMKSEHLLKTTNLYAGTLPDGYGYFPSKGGYVGAPYNQSWNQSENPYRGRRSQHSVAQQVSKDGRKGQQQAFVGSSYTQATPAQPIRADLGDRKGGKSRKPKKTTESKPLSLVSPPQMNTQHFPPLGRQRAGSFKTGYAKDFKKFSRDDVLRILQSVTDITSFEILPAAKECGVLASAPNKTLEIASLPTVVAAATPSAPSDTSEATKDWPQREWPDKQPAKVEIPPSSTDASDKSAPSDKSVPSDKSLPSPVVTAAKSMPKVPSYADIALGVSRTNSPPITQPPGSPATTHQAGTTSTN